MGRGSSDDDSDTTPVATRRGSFGRIGPTTRGFAKLREQLESDGWKGPYRFDHWGRTEQKVFTSSEGADTWDGPRPGFLKTHRNVSVLLRHEDDHITVMEEILHPSGVLFRRHECGADIDKAIETFARSIDGLRELQIGSMAETQYDLPRDWLASLIAERFRRSARHEVKAEIRERQRQVELEARTDIDELAAMMMAEAGFEPEILSAEPV